MDLSSLRTDATLTTAGTWIQYDENTRFRIASGHSPTYKKALRRATAKVPAHKLKNDAELAERLTADVMAEHVLLGWEGVTDNGQPLEPTVENRKAAMRIPAFRDWVAEQAMDLANFQAEGEAGNVADIKSGD